ncbi:hypothetical protein PENSPDRAFT_367569 [Peniophora sp. CONT]|nr:hypothetical protein PENSPDRAFT_367569 [Peniophora sp. CONT]
MSLGSLNITQEAQALSALYKSTASSVAPLLILESFMMGVLCACVPVGSYMLWVRPLSLPRTPSVSMLWIVLATIIIHWALSLRQLEDTLSGRSLGTFVTLDVLDAAINTVEFNETDLTWHAQPNLDDIYITYDFYGRVWQYLLPLITETVFFGFASSLFLLVAYTSFRQLRPRGRSCYSLVIPVMASVMYTLSLAHWAVSLHCFVAYTRLAPTGGGITSSVDIDAIQLALTALFCLNAVMSDSIVLWRMCAVWERAHTVFVFGAAMLVATFGLNIANIVEQAELHSGNRVVHGINHKDVEIIVTYGQTLTGLAAAFLSLASNLCATALVGLKIWLHRRKFAMHVRTGNRRTMVERVMELLVDSGVVYTAIWLLYCISFYRPITSQVVLGPAKDVDAFTVTAVSYLDAAMAQITSIYPLAVFILVALDKVHHSRGPRVLRNDDGPKERAPVEAVTVTFEIDIERSTIPIPDSAHPMAEISCGDPGKVAGVAEAEEKHGAMRL